jgi:hypothetical protein
MNSRLQAVTAAFIAGISIMAYSGCTRRPVEREQRPESATNGTNNDQSETVTSATIDPPSSSGSVEATPVETNDSIPALPDDINHLMNRYQISISLLSVKITKFDLPRFELLIPGYWVWFEISGVDANKIESPYGRLSTEKMQIQGTDDLLIPGAQDLDMFADSVAGDTLWFYFSGISDLYRGQESLFTARFGTKLVPSELSYDENRREFFQIQRETVTSNDQKIHFELKFQIRIREADVPKTSSPRDALPAVREPEHRQNPQFPIPENNITLPNRK